MARLQLLDTVIRWSSFLSIPRLRCSFTKIPLEGLQRPQISSCTVVTCINCGYKHAHYAHRKPWWSCRWYVFIIYASVMTKAVWRVCMTTGNAVHTCEPHSLLNCIQQALAQGGEWFQNFLHNKAASHVRRKSGVLHGWLMFTPTFG